MLIGGTIPFLVAAITMNAVGDAAFAMIEEIRRQFREIPGLLEGKPGASPTRRAASTSRPRRRSGR